MPAMHLMSVDLPAPLSPTNAITSPARASKSTSVSACTEPKAFETPRSSRSGWSLIFEGWWRRPESRLHPFVRLLLAVLRELAGADVTALEESALDEDLPVRLRDRLRRDQERRLLRTALRVDEARRRDLLTLHDRDRGLRRLRREDPHVLEHRHRLPTRDDVLHALRRRVLAAQGDRLQMMLLQVDHDRVGETVVRRGDCVDLVGLLD